MNKQILKGPQGATLTLDPNEIHPEDPGAGTPAIIEWKGCTATYECGRATGEVDDWDTTRQLPQRVLNWLNSEEIESAVDKMFDDYETAHPGCYDR